MIGAHLRLAWRSSHSGHGGLSERKLLLAKQEQGEGDEEQKYINALRPFHDVYFSDVRLTQENETQQDLQDQARKKM
jgi:hypothetical protein